MSKEIPKEVKVFVRATLISAPNGIQQTKFSKDYEKYAQTKLEFEKMGFESVYEFLMAIPDVARLTYSEKHKENLVFGVANKDVYSSSHARKAASKGTIGPRHKPPSEWGKSKNNNMSNKQTGMDFKARNVNVAKDLSSLTVTLSNNKDKGVCPNRQGLHGVQISNLPRFCAKEELELIFQEYRSLRECKVVTHPSRDAIAFVKFADVQDAVMALQQKNGYEIRGFQLKLNKAKDGTEDSQKQHNSQKSDKSRPILKKQGESYQVVVNNMSPVVTEHEIIQLYSKYGFVRQVEVMGSDVMLNYSTQEEAVATVKNFMECHYGGQKLPISPGSPGTAWMPQHNQQLQPSQSMQPGTNRDLQWSGSFCGSSTSSFSSSTGSLDRSSTTASSNENATFTSTANALERNKVSANLNSIQNLGAQKPQQQQQPQQQQPQQPQPQPQKQQPQKLLPQQQPQQKLLQQQQQQQIAGHFSPKALTAAASAGPASTAEVVLRSVRLILNKEEMERMNRVCGHHIDLELDNLPGDWDILVTEVVNACHFWAIVDYKTGNWTRLEDIEQNIRQFNSKPNVPEKYSIGAGRFTENDAWYRCFVLDVSYNGKHIKVIYTDYGNAEWIALERFTTLDQKMWSLPPQAKPFHLEGLELSTCDSKNVKEGATFLKELICNKTFIARKKPTANPRQSHIVEVELMDRRQLGQTINSLLATTGFVKPLMKVEMPVKQNSDSQINIVDALKSPTLKKENGSQAAIKILLCWVYSPADFYYNLITPETRKTVTNIETLLNEIPLTSLFFPRVGQTACYAPPAHGRKRVKILHIPKPSNVFHTVTEVEVFYLDTGMLGVAPVNFLLQMPHVVTSIQSQARHACLADVKLPDGQTSWPTAAAKVLCSHEHLPYEAKIANRLQDGRVVLNLWNEKGEYVNEKVMEFVTPQNRSRVASSTNNKNIAYDGNLQADRWKSNKKASSPVPRTRAQMSPPNESKTGHQLRKAPASLTGSQSKPIAQAIGTQVHNSQSDRTYYPKQADYTYKPITSDKSRGNNSSQGQTCPDLNSAKNKTTEPFSYYMPPPPYDAKVKSAVHSVHAQHTGPVAQGLPLARSGVDDKSLNTPPLHDVKVKPTVHSVHAQHTGPVAQVLPLVRSAVERSLGTPPSYDKVNPAVHATHAQRTRPVEQGLPRAWSGDDDISLNNRNFTANERLRSQPSQSVFPMSSQSNTSPDSLKRDKREEPKKDEGIIVAKQQTGDSSLVQANSSNKESSRINQSNDQTLATSLGCDRKPMKKKPDSLSAQGWRKEKEQLLSRRLAQDRYLEKLNKQETLKPTIQNLQEIKSKLEKQVRIKELENRTLKLKKEVEAMEAMKAELQYQLMNS